MKNELTAQEIINGYLNMIIDEIHPYFTAVSDEEMVEQTEEYGIFERKFKHQNNKTFLMRWKVIFGTPETVKTIFEPAKIIS